jgi:transposase
MAIAMAVGGASKKDIAETLSVCRQTIYKLLKEVEEEEQDFA